MIKTETVKLCPYPAKPVGIKKENGIKRGVETRYYGGKVLATVGLEDKKNTGAFYGADVYYTLGLQPTDKDAITSLLCSGGAVGTSIASLEDKLIQYHNEYRAQQGLPALKKSRALSRMAKAYANNMAYWNFYGGAAHVDIYGRTFPTRFKMYNSAFKSGGENIGSITNITGEDKESLIGLMFEGWLNSPGHHANIVGNFTHIGVGIASRYIDYGGQQVERFFYVVDFANYGDLTTETPEYFSQCLGHISWQYERFTYTGFGGVKLGTEYNGYILFFITAPFNCYLKEIVLNSPKGTLGSVRFSPSKDGIINNKTPAKKIKVCIKYDTRTGYLNIGDELRAYAVYDYGNKDLDNVVLIATRKFETHNYAVGTVQGAVLEYPDGTYSEIKIQIPDEWKNKKSLRWLVEKDGQTLPLRPVGYYNFQPGDKVLILKGGEDREFKDYNTPPELPDWDAVIETPDRIIVKKGGEIQSIEKEETDETVEALQDKAGANIDKSTLPTDEFIEKYNSVFQEWLNMPDPHLKLYREYLEMPDFRYKILQTYYNMPDVSTQGKYIKFQSKGWFYDYMNMKDPQLEIYKIWRKMPSKTLYYDTMPDPHLKLYREWLEMPAAGQYYDIGAGNRAGSNEAIYQSENGDIELQGSADPSDTENGILRISTSQDIQLDKKLYNVKVKAPNGDITFQKYRPEDLEGEALTINKTKWAGAAGNTAALDSESIREEINPDIDFVIPFKFKGA